MNTWYINLLMRNVSSIKTKLNVNGKYFTVAQLRYSVDTVPTWTKEV